MTDINNKYSDLVYKIAKRYVKRKGVVGIIWIGSATFGIEDEFVDIDIRLLIDRDEKYNPMEQFDEEGIKIEVDEMSLGWLLENLTTGSEQAWIIEKSIVLYDPEGKTTLALEESKNKLSKLDNKKLLWNSYSQLYLHYDLEKSLIRNQIITAHIILSNILDALSKFVFLYQDKVIPPQKWRWYMIRKDKLFDMDNVDKLLQLNLLNSKEEIDLLIRGIQKDCQKIMLGLGFEKDKVMEPWRF